MVVQLPFSEWLANGAEVSLCQLPLRLDQLERRHGLRFEPKEPQLPFTRHAVIAVDGQTFLLTVVPEGDSTQSLAEVVARGDIRDLVRALASICEAFGVSRETLPWVTDDLSSRPWVLYRLDDNGNRFLMSYFRDKALAEQLAQRYAERGHKQSYYVEKAP